MKKISLIGAGQIGGTLAHLIGLKVLGFLQFDQLLLKIFFSYFYFIVGITNSAFDLIPEGHLEVIVLSFV